MDCILRSYFDRTHLYTYHIPLKVARLAIHTIVIYFTPYSFIYAAVPQWGKPVNVLKHAPAVTLSTKSINLEQLGNIVQDRLRPKTTTTASPAFLDSVLAAISNPALQDDKTCDGSTVN